MRVSPKDGCCRECGGPLDVIDADDETLTVACAECADSYEVETDAFNDGGIAYWPLVMARKLKGGNDEPA